MSAKTDIEKLGVLPYASNSGKLDLQLRCLLRFFQQILREIKSKQGLPWRQRLRSLKCGFNSSSWFLYQLGENNPKLYVNDFRTALRMYKINGFFNPIIGDKLVLSRLAAAHGIPHPEVVSIIHDGRLIDDKEPTDPDMTTTLSRTLDRHPQQVFRPTWTGGGSGVFFLRKTETRLQLNGQDVSMEQVCSMLSKLDRYLATAFEEQAEYASKIFPGSPNTLRILTLWDIKNNSPYIAAISHRFGSSRSVPIDNWHRGAGGFCASVDMGTSTMGPAVSVSKDKQIIWNTEHPETGQAIAGVKIPGLNDCLDGLLKAAAHFPFCPLIGWDVILTEVGYSVLEANTLPSLKVWQVHKPLLSDPRSRAFFHHWGMASGDRS